MSRELGNYQGPFSFPVPFWLERIDPFRSSIFTVLSQIQMSSPYPLSSTYPDLDSQEDTFLTIGIPDDESSFVTLSGSLFIQTRRIK